MVEHFYVTLDDASCTGFEIPCGKTETQTNGDKNSKPVTAVGVAG